MISDLLTSDHPCSTNRLQSRNRAQGRRAQLYARFGSGSGPGVTSASLVYDPLGRLFQTSGGSEGVTQFLYDGDALIGEYDSAGSMIRRYVHGTAEGVDDPLIWYDHITAGTRRGLITDHQGSVISVLNLVGTPIAINGYDSWGIPNSANQGPSIGTGVAFVPVGLLCAVGIATFPADPEQERAALFARCAVGGPVSVI